MGDKGKTPWENMKGGNSHFIKNLNKSSGRLNREERVNSLMSKELKGEGLVNLDELVSPWEKIFWWAWRIGVGIDVGLILMAIYSKLVGWI